VKPSQLWLGTRVKFGGFECKAKEGNCQTAFFLPECQPEPFPDNLVSRNPPPTDSSSEGHLVTSSQKS
jgi:hypothetical protein